MNTGYLYAILTSLGMSLYIVPKKISKHLAKDYNVFLALGFSLCCVIYFITTSSLSTLKNIYLLFSCLAGIIWTIGGICFATAIDKIGLSRSAQWKNLQGPSGAIISLIVLKEASETNIWCIILAATLLFSSAVMFTIKQDDGKKVSKIGITFAIASGIIFGITSTIQKYVSGHVSTVQPQQLCFSLSIFVSATIYALIKNKNLNLFKTILKKDSMLGIVAGMIYFATSFFQVASYKYLPNAIAITIIQFNVVWTIIIGILIFKEINFKKNWVRITIGYIFALLSLITLLKA